MFVEVLYFFWGVFLDVLVVLDRFAVLDCDFFCKKIIFVKSCQKYIVSLWCEINVEDYETMFELWMCRSI